MKSIIGGIGDILLSMERAISSKEDLILISHYNNAPSLLNAFGVEPLVSYYFSNIYELEVYKDLYKIYIGHDTYPTFKLPKSFNDVKLQDKRFDIRSKWVGVHPFGSNFSKDYFNRVGAPGKDLPDILVDLIDAHIPKDYGIVVFGNEFELAAIRSPNERVVLYDGNRDIINSLAVASGLDYCIAADSCIKTMTSIRKIPTLLLLQNNLDKIRDDKFINPYLASNGGSLDVIYYDKFSDKLLENILDRIKHTLK